MKEEVAAATAAEGRRVEKEAPAAAAVQCRVNRVEEGSRVEKEAAAAAVGARGC